MTETLEAKSLWTLDELVPDARRQVAYRLATAVLGHPGSGNCLGGWLPERYAVAVLAALESPSTYEQRLRIVRAVVASVERFVVLTSDGWAQAEGPRAAAMYVERALRRGSACVLIDTATVAESLTPGGAT